MSEERIYVLIAETVQHPLRGSDGIWNPTPITKTIIQPKGRIAAQVGHVVSRMRMERLARMHTDWFFAVSHKKKKEAEHLLSDLTLERWTMYTTIVLSVPNSYALNFRWSLLDKVGVRVHACYDKNDEYGMGDVCTAICTEPIDRSTAKPALDYLQLWS